MWAIIYVAQQQNKNTQTSVQRKNLTGFWGVWSSFNQYKWRVLRIVFVLGHFSSQDWCVMAYDERWISSQNWLLPLSNLKQRKPSQEDWWVSAHKLCAFKLAHPINICPNSLQSFCTWTEFAPKISIIVVKSQHFFRDISIWLRKLDHRSTLIGSNHVDV